MLEAGTENISVMDVRQLIRPDIAASAIAHLSVLALVLLFSDVHPFGAVTAEPITVDLVTPEEAAQKPQLAQPDPAALTPPPPVPSKREQSEARQERREASPQPQSAPPAKAAPPSGQPPIPQVEPDVTVKYHVALGLPDAQALAGPSDAGPGDGVDATASGAADLSSSVVAAFRKHLKTCSRLPASISRSDNVRVKLRVLMTPQASLAAEPILIEGTASMKGVELKKSAVEALAACQPYNMFPADRFDEWRVLDLTFTPNDFV